MVKELYIIAPPLIAISIQLIFPYFHTLSIPEVWFSPPPYITGLVFIGAYILFGFTLYKADEIKNYDIFILTWFLVLLNLLWSYYVKRNEKYAMIFLFISLLFGYFIYNELFLSSLVEGGKPLYLNLFSTYIIWLGFVITIIFESVNRRKKKISKKY